MEKKYCEEMAEKDNVLVAEENFDFAEMFSPDNSMGSAIPVFRS